MAARRDVAMTAQEIQDFLATAMTAVVSSYGPDGFPHSAAMWFICDDDAFHMWTYGKSQKARNLMRDPRCALLVESGEAYSELRGVLVKGRVDIVTEFDKVADIGRRLYDRYTLPRTGIAYEDGPIVEVERQARKRVGLVLPMQKIASWDHGKL